MIQACFGPLHQLLHTFAVTLCTGQVWPAHPGLQGEGHHREGCLHGIPDSLLV
jgi:hypothetical protein